MLSFSLILLRFWVIRSLTFLNSAFLLAAKLSWIVWPKGKRVFASSVTSIFLFTLLFGLNCWRHLGRSWSFWRCFTWNWLTLGSQHHFRHSTKVASQQKWIFEGQPQTKRCPNETSTRSSVSFAAFSEMVGSSSSGYSSSVLSDCDCFWKRYSAISIQMMLLMQRI